MIKDNFFKKAAFMKNKTLFLSLMIVLVVAGVWIALAAELVSVAINAPSANANISGTYVFNATTTGDADNVTFYYNSSGGGWTQICINTTAGTEFTCSDDTSGIGDGVDYIVNATARNLTAERSTSVSSITFDNIGPTVSEITSPANNTWITGSVNMTIAINGSDAIDSALDIAVYVNNTINVSTVADNVTIAGTDVTLTGLLDNSTYLLILEVTDDSGNKKNSSEFILKYDTAAPYSSSLYPSDGSYVNDNTPLIYALVSDPGSGVANNSNINITQDGTPIPTRTVVGTSYQVNVSYTSSNIPEGTNTTITLDADDSAGNSMTQASWWFVIDLTNPAVTSFATNDSDSNVTSTDYLNFSVTVTDINGSVSTVTMNGTTLTQAGTTWYTINQTNDFSAPTDGSCDFLITATDAAGNVNNTVTLSLKVDDTNPAVTNFASNDTDDKVESTDYLNFSVTVTNGGSGISTVTMNDTSLSQIGATNVFVGKSNNTETLTITIDDANPLVTNFDTNDSDEIVKSADYLNFSVTVSDSNINTVTMNSTSLSQIGATGVWYTVNQTNDFSGCSAVTDGACTFLITATDDTANVNNTETLTITIDDVNPVVTSFAVNHTNYNVTNSTSLNFSVSVSDSNINTVTMNGTSLAQIGSTNLWYNLNNTGNFDCGADGDCLFLITATDDTANVNNTETLTLKVDNVNPVVSISYPSASQNISSTIIEVNGTASDTNNATNAITINDSRWGDNTGTYADWVFQNTSAVSDGTYTVLITANDSAGNLNNTETITFTVDNTAPTASAWVPTNNSYSNSASPTRSVNISDSTSGVLNSTSEPVQMEVKVDAGAWINVTSSSTTSGDKSMFKITYSSGTYSDGKVIYVRANAKDYAGNSMPQAEWQFTIDLVNPAVTSFATNDSDSNVTSTDYLNFSVTVADTNAGVSTVTVNGTSLSQIGSTNVWQATLQTSDFGDCTTDGDCVFGIIATDAAGNINNTEILTLAIDDTNLAVTDFKVNDTDNITKSTDYLNFSVTVTDGGAPASSVTMNGTSLTQIGSTGVWYNINQTSQISGCTAVTDGACTFLITATDVVGKSNNTETLTITIDDANPLVTNFDTDDSDEIVESTDLLNFSVSVSDSNIDTVTMNDTTLTQIASTGVWYTLNSTSNFTGCAVTDGACTFLITATDKTANVNNTEILTVTIDNVNPVVTSFAVDDGDNIVRSTDVLNFSVSVSDSNINTVTMNDTTLTQIASTGVWFTINQTDDWANCGVTGACTFLITATDQTSNVNNTETLTITIDDTNPAVTSFAVNDTDNIVRSADYLNFSVTVADSGGGSVSTVTMNGTTLTQIASTGVWYTINRTDDWTGCDVTGACMFLITATDNVSNVNNSEYITITIDDTNPSVTSFAVNDSDYNVTSTDYLNFSVSVSDSGGGSVSTVTMNGTTLTQIASTGVWYTVNQTDDWTDCSTSGYCVFGITATGNVSNVNNTETITIMIDGIAPTVSLISPGGGDWRSDNTTDFTFTVTDTLSSVLSCILYADSTNVGHNYSVVNNTLTTITSTSELDEGAIDWYVNCTDGAGNEGTATERTVKIDVTPPTFTVSQPSLNQEVNSSALTILSSVADDGIGSQFTGVSSCAVSYVDSGSTSRDLTPGTINFNGTHCTGTITIPSSAAEGNGTLTLALLDMAGNQGSATQYINFTLIADTTPPSLGLTAWPYTPIVAEPFWIIVDETANETGLTCRYELINVVENAYAGSGMLGEMSIATYGISYGTTIERPAEFTSSNVVYNLTFNCTDSAGNSASTWVNFTINTTYNMHIPDNERGFRELRSSFILSRHQLMGTALTDYNISTVINSTAGLTSQKLDTAKVNYVWGYIGSTWYAYNTTDSGSATLTTFNHSIGYYVLDLKQDGIGRFIMH